MATAFDPFSKLSMRTQAALLKHNADLVVSLRGAIFFEQRKQGLDQVLHYFLFLSFEFIK